MSEPSYGTDVLGMHTTAVRNNSGGYTLNGGKMWITNGCVDDENLGDVFLVYARTAAEDTPASRSISLFLVEKVFLPLSQLLTESNQISHTVVANPRMLIWVCFLTARFPILLCSTFGILIFDVLGHDRILTRKPH